MKNKDVVYIDVEDEITGVIDKLKSSTANVVALVLPKRAPVFQSVVNMKLLKRAAEQAKKNIVLVTSEAGLLPLAGVVGLYVAKTLESTPEIPHSPTINDSPISVDEPVFKSDDTENKPVGELAGLAPLPPEEDEAIELDNEDKEEEKPGKDLENKKSKVPKMKKIKVPNFERFRLLIILGVLFIVILIAVWYVGFKILPKATITIKTNTSSVNTNLTLTLDSTAQSLNAANAVVPAKIVSIKKTSVSPQITTTGQKNEGNTATGSVTMTAQICNSITPPSDVPSGTDLTTNGLVFITKKDTSFSFSSISGGCINYSSNSSTSIVAQQPGTKYDISAANFTVTGRPEVSASSSSATTGGTDNNVQIVAQVDVNSAQAQIVAPDSNAAKQSLEQTVQQDGLDPINATFVAGTATYSPSTAVGAQSNSVTVTETITYTMYGVSQNDLNSLIDSNVNQQINPSQQSIVNSGAGQASFQLQTTSPTSVQVTMQASSTVGPLLNVNSIKQQSAGLRSGDIKNFISGLPGVTSVNVHYSPFWVTATPKQINKITVIVQ